MLAEEEAATVRAERTRDARHAARGGPADRLGRRAHPRPHPARGGRAGRRDRVDGARRGGAHHRHRPLEGEQARGRVAARLTELERQRNQVTSQLGALRDQVTQQLSALRNQLAAATAAIELPGMDEAAKAVGSPPKAVSRI